jgi:hypothetical protein
MRLFNNRIKLNGVLNRSTYESKEPKQNFVLQYENSRIKLISSKKILEELQNYDGEFVTLEGKFNKQNHFVVKKCISLEEAPFFCSWFEDKEYIFNLKYKMDKYKSINKESYAS